MIEVLMVSLVMLVVAVCAFAPLGCTIFAQSKTAVAAKTKVSESVTEFSGILVPEDSVLKRHFLAQLQAEIEATLFPRPTDSMLQRHYDALVASELESRLAGGR